MAASNLLYSCPVFSVNRVFFTFLAAKSVFFVLLAKENIAC